MLVGPPPRPIFKVSRNEGACPVFVCTYAYLIQNIVSVAEGIMWLPGVSVHQLLERWRSPFRTGGVRVC